jgi:hypothetical protein
MRHDILVCTNEVNYAIARGLISQGLCTSPWVLIDTTRCTLIAMPGVRQWRLSIHRWRVLRLMLAIPGLLHIGTLFIPHHRLNRRVNKLTAVAERVDYLDDGLDTRRVKPRNFDLDRIERRPRYYTFLEYKTFPAWMTAFEIRPIVSIKCIASPGRHAPPELVGATHLFVESPGMSVDTVVAHRGLNPQHVLVLRHPAIIKRQAIDPRYRCIEGRDVGLDHWLTQVSGHAVYFGETLSMYIALAQGVDARNTLFAQMSPEQWDGLIGLPITARERLADGSLIATISRSGMSSL